MLTRPASVSNGSEVGYAITTNRRAKKPFMDTKLTLPRYGLVETLLFLKLFLIFKILKKMRLGGSSQKGGDLK